MDPSGKRHVFLVDDNAVFRTLIRDVVTGMGFRLTEAADSPDARTLLEKHHPTLDVALIDLVLPSENGIQLLEGVRKKPWGASMPVMILTGADPDPAMKADFARLQAGHLDKAHTVDRLGPMLTQLFGRLAQAGR